MKQIARTKGTLLRVFACVWAVVALALTCAAPAFAADVPTGSITVNNVDGASSGSAYKVIDVNWNGSEPVDPMYKWNDSVAQWVSDNYSDYIDAKGYVTETYSKAKENDGKAIKKFAEDLQLAIINNKVAATKTVAISSDTVTFDSLNAGGYLVSIAGKTDVFTPVISNVNLDSDNSWAVVSPKVEAKKSKVTFEKKILESDGNLVDTATAGIGDDVTFRLTSTAPIYPSNAVDATYKIGDQMDPGLTFKEILSVKVNGTDLDAAKYEVKNTDAQNFTINFTDPSAISGAEITVEYKATLNGNAVVGETGNPNSATLTYSHDPYHKGQYNDIPDKVNVFTFGIEIFKVDKADNTKFLSGATFKVKKGGSVLKFKLVNGVYRLAADGDVEVLPVDDNGKLYVDGLDAGEYKLEEVKAPNGYARLNADATVTIVASKPEGSVDYNGHVSGESTTKAGYTNAKVENAHGWSLPATGDAGLFALVAAGIVLVGGGIMVVRSRRAE